MSIGAYTLMPNKTGHARPSLQAAKSCTERLLTRQHIRQPIHQRQELVPERRVRGRASWQLQPVLRESQAQGLNKHLTTARAVRLCCEGAESPVIASRHPGPCALHHTLHSMV
eukprot:4267815-Pleurochrysis_carterae.AAC.1